jgi:hypothetical protein
MNDRMDIPLNDTGKMPMVFFEGRIGILLSHNSLLNGLAKRL